MRCTRCECSALLASLCLLVGCSDGDSLVVGEEPQEHAPFEAKLRLLLVSDTGVSADETGIGRWQDLSPAGNDAVQATLPERPMLDSASENPGILFTYDQNLDLPPQGFTGLDAGCTLFWVGQVDSDSQPQWLLRMSAGEDEQISLTAWANDQDAGVEVADVQAKGKDVLEMGRPLLLSARYGSGAIDVRVDGLQATTAPSSLVPASTFETVTVGRLFTGTVRAVAVYDESLSDEQMLSVESFLKRRTGCCQL